MLFPRFSLPEFLDFKLLGKTSLVIKEFGLFGHSLGKFSDFPRESAVFKGNPESLPWVTQATGPLCSDYGESHWPTQPILNSPKSKFPSQELRAWGAKLELHRAHRHVVLNAIFFRAKICRPSPRKGFRKRSILFSGWWILRVPPKMVSRLWLWHTDRDYLPLGEPSTSMIVGEGTVWT